MSRQYFPLIPFNLLVNEENRAVSPRAEPRLLNLFPLNEIIRDFRPSDLSQNTLNLFPVDDQSFPPTDQSQKTLNLFPAADQSLNTQSLLPVSESQKELSPFPPRDESAQPPCGPLFSLLGAQVQVVPQGILPSPEEGAENKELERGPPRRNSINTQQPGENYEGISNSSEQGGRKKNKGSSSQCRDVPSTLNPPSHHTVREISTAGRTQHETIPPRKRRNAAKTRGPVKKSSRFTGVTFYKRTGRWEAHIWHEKQLYLGASTSEIQAARAYDRALIHFRGSTTTALNFNLSDYEGELDLLEAISDDKLIKALRRQSKGAGKPMPDYGTSTGRA